MFKFRDWLPAWESLMLTCAFAGDIAALSTLQLVQSAINSMDSVSLGWSSMAHAVDDKEQHIQLLQESSKLQQLQHQLQSFQS